MKGAFEGLGCYVKKLTNPTKQAAEQFLNKGKINWIFYQLYIRYTSMCLQLQNFYLY